MKILIASDLHLECAAFEPPRDVEFDVAVLAGDIHSPARRAVEWAGARFGDKPVVYVPGNHEFYRGRMDTVLDDARTATSDGRVHLLDAGEALIGGVRFLGATLWTDFALALDTPQGRRSDPAAHKKTATRLFIDYAMIRITDLKVAGKARRNPPVRVLTAEDTCAIHRLQCAWLLDRLRQPFSGPTVVVTHHAPHRRSLAARFAEDWTSCAFVNELPDAFFEVPVLWIHGHTHESFDYNVRHCRVVCNPRGYGVARNPAGNAHFNPRLVIEIATCP
jgi:hypothetical protein